MEMAMKTHFTFQSDGEMLVGNLFLLERGRPVGVVVAVGPLTSVKEQAAGTYAEAMAGRGYAALAFDYRYFGESGGQPRQFENPEANIEDIRNAATALLADERLARLPLVGLGVCFGAGPMVRAVAEDARFRAFAGVAGVYTDNARTKAMMGDACGRELSQAGALAPVAGPDRLLRRPRAHRCRNRGRSRILHASPMTPSCMVAAFPRHDEQGDFTPRMNTPLAGR
jgi:fermentation-respiration switch protein FrsA (DUF1100 family)